MVNIQCSYMCQSHFLPNCIDISQLVQDFSHQSYMYSLFRVDLTIYNQTESWFGKNVHQVQWYIVLLQALNLELGPFPREMWWKFHPDRPRLLRRMWILTMPVTSLPKDPRLCGGKGVCQWLGCWFPSKVVGII